MYWSREILKFFAVTDEDMPVFMNFHENYKIEIKEKTNQRNFSHSH